MGAHLLIGKLILKKLNEMNPCFPLIEKKEKVLMQKARVQLKNEQNKE
jgi:hypothetical protein